MIAIIGGSGHAVDRGAPRAAHGRPVYWLPEMDDAKAFLRRELREGDLLLTLGAGNVNELAERLGEGE